MLNRVLMLLICCMLLGGSGCGQVGPLYLPTQKHTAG